MRIKICLIPRRLRNALPGFCGAVREVALITPWRRGKLDEAKGAWVRSPTRRVYYAINSAVLWYDRDNISERR